MALVFSDLYNIVADMIDRSETEDITRVKQFVNMAARDVWCARPWRERRKDAYVECAAPYTTGTATFTEDSTALTGVATVWSTAFVGRKVALSYSAPWYVMTTRVGDTSFTLNRAYAESTASGSTYVVYNDVATLASDVDSLIQVRIQNNGAFTTLSYGPQRRMDEAFHLPGFAGVPTHYSLIENSSTGYMQIRLWPVPDDTYVLHYRYLASFTDLSGDSDACVVPENRRDLVIQRALAWAYQYVNEPGRARDALEVYEHELAKSWRVERDIIPLATYMRRFDQWSGRTGNPIPFPIAE